MAKEALAYVLIVAKTDSPYDITDTKLYKIMKEAIEIDKPDKNIVFSLPYPVVFRNPNSIFLQFATNYLHAIYDCLKENVDLSNRRIYIIYPSSKKNQFALKDMSSYYIEYIDYPELEEYFSYEVIGVG